MPAVPDVLHQLLAAYQPSDTALGAQDRAMLLLRIGAALRRSELVALQLRDIKSVPKRGIRLLVQRSKTDQYGKSQDLAVQASPADPAVCPLAVLSELVPTGILSGVARFLTS